MNNQFKYQYCAITSYYESYKIAYIDLNPHLNEVLLCLHGINRNCRDFDRLAQCLLSENRYRILLVDVVGRGKSDWLENKNAYNYDTYVSSIYQLLNTLGINKVSILGTSMGGIIAMFMASKFPQLVQKIILNDIGPYINYDTLLYNSLYIATYPSFQNLDEARIFMKKYFSPISIKNDQDIEHILNHGVVLCPKENKYSLAYDPNIGLAYRENIVSKSSANFDIWNIWHTIETPIFVIKGEKSKFLTNETLMKMIYSKKNISYIEIANVGHAPSLFENEHIMYIDRWLNNAQYY